MSRRQRSGSLPRCRCPRRRPRRRFQRCSLPPCTGRRGSTWCTCRRQPWGRLLRCRCSRRRPRRRGQRRTLPPCMWRRRSTLCMSRRHRWGSLRHSRCSRRRPCRGAQRRMLPPCTCSFRIMLRRCRRQRWGSSLAAVVRVAVRVEVVSVACRCHHPRSGSPPPWSSRRPPAPPRRPAGSWLCHHRPHTSYICPAVASRTMPYGVAEARTHQDSSLTVHGGVGSRCAGAVGNAEAACLAAGARVAVPSTCSASHIPPCLWRRLSTWCMCRQQRSGSLPRCRCPRLRPRRGAQRCSLPPCTWRRLSTWCMSRRTRSGIRPRCRCSRCRLLVDVLSVARYRRAWGGVGARGACAVGNPGADCLAAGARVAVLVDVGSGARYRRARGGVEARCP